MTALGKFHLFSSSSTFKVQERCYLETSREKWLRFKTKCPPTELYFFSHQEELISPFKNLGDSIFSFSNMPPSPRQKIEPFKTICIRINLFYTHLFWFCLFALKSSNENSPCNQGVVCGLNWFRDANKSSNIFK